AVSSFLVNYPFANRLFPGSLDALEHVRAFGPTVILSDGDVVFQPLKVNRSGLFEAVEGRVLIYIHKEQELDDVERRHPAAHYVLVDDKVRILAPVKELWGERLTTDLPRQGHHAPAPAAARGKPAAGLAGEGLCFGLALEDLARAADLFRSMQEATNGVDGWGSLEVSPTLADDTASTVAAAKDLHARAARRNLFIKIPG